MCGCRAVLQLASNLLQHGAARLSEAPLRDYALVNSRENVALLNEIERRVMAVPLEQTYNAATPCLYVLDTLLMSHLADRLREVRCGCGGNDTAG